MARNEEKAQSMLNRYLKQKDSESGRGLERRPYLATLCDDVDEAQKWRREILRDIGRKVMEIQNAGLGEGKIRELNDGINKLFREKKHWERRIKDLGGPDFSRNAAPVTDSDGTLVAGSKGYYYFGAARNLPGVKELLATQAQYEEEKRRVSSAELYRRVDADYYGYRDEDDGVLVKLEAEAEERARKELIREFEERHPGVAPSLRDLDSDTTGDFTEPYQSYIRLPNRDDIEKVVLERRKKEALASLETALSSES
mmetsp:Transcript_7597/g.23034  ORF Transcript_7597/g.23034 Transcript_7597/m.23034 type:complete len:256 (+) Transcript_7597:101-868(+)